MPLSLGRKSKIFIAVLLLNGAFLFFSNVNNAEAYHATSSYNKLFNDTLTSQNWNDLFSDFVNTWLPTSMNGPLGIATSAPLSGLEVNGNIRGTNIFSAGNVGFGVNNPSAMLEVVPVSGYAILAGNQRIGNVALPILAADVATKGYVDSYVASSTGATFWDGSLTGGIYNMNTGNVGVGTTSPRSKLHISAGAFMDAYIGTSLPISAPDLVTLGAGISFTRTDMQFPDSGIAAYKSNTGGNNLAIKGRGDIVFVSGNISDERMRIKELGNVGIGTSTPMAKLSIAPSTGYAILAGNYKIGNVALPTIDTDAATKGYVDSYVASFVAAATGTISGVARYVGVTPTTYTGDNNGVVGYATAQAACAAAYASSTVCTPDHILSSIAAGIALPAQDIWIFAGPPGYTAAANDCEGRSIGTTAAYGTYWQQPMTGRPQGRGLLMRCNNALRLACCR